MGAPFCKRRARSGGHPGRKADMRFETDHAGSMDHAHGDGLLIRREATKLRLGSNGGEGLPINRCTVGFVSVRHQ